MNKMEVSYTISYGCGFKTKKIKFIIDEDDLECSFLDFEKLSTSQKNAKTHKLVNHHFNSTVYPTNIKFK
jgi:hypothetical protein